MYLGKPQFSFVRHQLSKERLPVTSEQINVFSSKTYVDYSPEYVSEESESYK